MKTLKNSNGGGSVKINISEAFSEAKNEALVMGWEVFEVHEIPGSPRVFTVLRYFVRL